MRSNEEIEEIGDDKLLTMLLSQGRPFEPPLFREAGRRGLLGRLKRLESIGLSLN